MTYGRLDTTQPLGYAALMRWTLFCLCLLYIPSAFAGEEELIVNAEIDYHRLFEEGGRNGVGLGADANYGINDTFGVTLQWKQAFVLTQSDNPLATARFFSIGAGVSVALDVLRVIPIVTLAPSYYRFTDAQGTDQNIFGAQLGLTFDYLLTRRAQVGVLAGGYQYRAGPLGVDTQPDSFVAGVRGGVIFSL